MCTSLYDREMQNSESYPSFPRTRESILGVARLLLMIFALPTQSHTLLDTPCYLSYLYIKQQRYPLGNDYEVGRVQISFRTRRLARTFNSASSLTRRHGDRMARTIQMRLAVLKNARTLSQVPTTPPDRRHMLRGDRSGQYAVDLVHPYRLVFVPDHDPIPRREDGGVNLDEVTAITIIEVVDYH